MSRPEGARVTGVTRNSPADQARLAIGDVILEFDGTRVEDDMHLINLVSLTPVNKDTFTWQSTDRTLDGEALENTPPVKVTRVR